MAGNANDNNALLLQVSADISRLEKQFQKASGIVDKQSTFMERRAKQMATKLEDASKINFGKALDNVFDSSRLKVMDSGIARIGLFGSALEPLGPLGIAAAAGIAAVGAALSGAREAAKFADDIGDTADRLHVTTNALQEYRYAIRAAGGEEKGADEALEGFSVTLGKAQEGLAKSQKAFIALGFTKEQIKGFTDAGTALDAVRKKMVGLSDAQRDAIIDQFGLTGLKSLLQQAVEEQDKLILDAHRLGLVMDSELVRKGGEINDQFETLEQVISVQLKSALIDLGPILTELLGIAADFSKDLLLTVQAIEAIQRNPVRAIKVENSARDIGRQGGLSGRALERSVANEMIAATTKVTPEFMKQWLEDQGGGKSGASRTLKDVSKPGSTPKDQTASKTAAVDSAVASADRALLQALLSLTDDIETRSQIQKRILDAENAQAEAAYKKQRDDIETSNSTDKAAQLAKLDAARATQRETEAVERRAIDAQALADIDAKRLSRHRKIADAEIGELQAQADITKSRKERRRLELEILARQKKLEDEARANDLADKQRRAQAAAGPGETVVVVDDGSVQRAADAKYSTDKSKILKDTQGPLADYLDSIQSLDDAMQNAAVDGLQSLNQGIVDLAQNGADAGSILKNVLNRILSDLATYGLEKAEGGILDYFKIGKNANGTNNWRGGLTWVGERGKELVNLPKGSQVIPNHALSGLYNMPSPQSFSSGRSSNDVHLHMSLDGASGDSAIRGIVIEGVRAAIAHSDRKLQSYDASLSGRMNRSSQLGAWQR